jgi:hypothetical protein
MAEQIRPFYLFALRRVSVGARIALNRAARRSRRARIQFVKGTSLDTANARPIK